MDRFVFRKLNFVQLFDVPPGNLGKLNKKQVIGLCCAEIGKDLQNTLLGFAFLGTKYIRFLSLEDVNTVFPYFIRAIQATLPQICATQDYHQVINLIAIIMAGTAGTLGLPSTQAAFRDIYSAIFSFIPESLRRLESSVFVIKQSHFIHDDFEATENVLLAYFTFITSRKFRIHRSVQERQLFEEVLVSLLDISQLMLTFDLQILNDTLQVLFQLIEGHQWIPSMSSGLVISDSATWLGYLIKFLLEAPTTDQEVYHVELKNLQVFYVALLKLFKLTYPSTVLFKCPLSDLMNVYGDYEKAIRDVACPERKNDLMRLKNIHMQLMNYFPIDQCVSSLRDLVPGPFTHMFCKAILHRIATEPRLVLEFRIDLLSFIYEAVQKNTIVLSEKERNNLIKFIVVILALLNRSHPAVFAKFLHFLVGLTFHGTSRTCPGFQFVFLLQDMMLTLLSPASLASAFRFYSAMAEQLSMRLHLPARGAFMELARNSYALLSPKRKRRLRDKVPSSTSDIFMEIDETRVQQLAKALTQRIDEFIGEPETFFQLQSALSAFMNIDTLTMSSCVTKLLEKAIDRLWTHLLVDPLKWAQFQWMGPFLNVLIRVCANINCNLMGSLKEITKLTLPQSTLAMILMALLDTSTGNHTHPKMDQFTLKMIKSCPNKVVLNYILSTHQLTGGKNKLLVKLLCAQPQYQTPPLNTNFPHNCCERTCCFILANSSRSPHPINHSPVVCNLEHAIEGLQISGTEMTRTELKDLEELCDEFRGTLGKMMGRE